MFIRNIILKDGVTLISGSFRIYKEFPDAVELSKTEPDSSQSKEDTADGQMGGRKRKKSTEETEERVEPCPSPFSNRHQKKPAKKLKFSQFLVPFVLCHKIKMHS